jgi:hypothetical protein
MQKAGLVSLAVAVLVLAACGGGGSMSHKALQQEAQTVQSLAAEGGILAGDAARGRSTTVFTREHAGFLLAAATSSARKLRRAGNAGALAPLAARVRDDLDRLSHSGPDRAEQRRLAVDLARAAHEASRLGKS